MHGEYPKLIVSKTCVYIKINKNKLQNVSVQCKTDKKLIYSF